MSDVLVGKVERIVLNEKDDVVILDAIGNRLRMAPNGARGLHRELGKFLAMANDATPLPAPTRADFKALKERVEQLEKKDEGES